MLRNPNRRWKYSLYLDGNFIGYAFDSRAVERARGFLPKGLFFTRVVW